jgi:hypothetical protein
MLVAVATDAERRNVAGVMVSEGLEAYFGRHCEGWCG